ncbi:hypothetical protein BP00DRAFT_491942 [Aspergillus indologenus CBS 114.80]|uniref:Uncharacterized protein n=1 Tax=Aspergillus indologenus CBS 114.80 TaxID=1450541 RepID=A0A2V5J284_9EURO|nr:hypothetical protein BP00DRAFT_491942 [Aspergillus indologenus CBS 114.80]
MDVAWFGHWFLVFDGGGGGGGSCGGCCSVVSAKEQSMYSRAVQYNKSGQGGKSGQTMTVTMTVRLPSVPDAGRQALMTGHLVTDIEAISSHHATSLAPPMSLADQ